MAIIQDIDKVWRVFEIARLYSKLSDPEKDSIKDKMQNLFPDFSLDHGGLLSFEENYDSLRVTVLHPITAMSFNNDPNLWKDNPKPLMKRQLKVKRTSRNASSANGVGFTDLLDILFIKQQGCKKDVPLN